MVHITYGVPVTDDRYYTYEAATGVARKGNIMATIYGIWNGGTGYGPSDLTSDLERFDSVTAARHALRDRRDSGHGWKQDFDFANREAESVYCPCVEDDSSIWLFLGTDEIDGEIVAPEYPDLIVEFGPRGAPVVTPA
jgi:hypothetical protein